MASFLSFVKRAHTSFNPPTAPPLAGSTTKPIRFGILSTAEIGIRALVLPARSHPDVQVVAVGGRTKEKTEAFAKKHGIKKVHVGYQSLLEDPDVDAVYIPLPNALHYEWTIKALQAGKHVLVEKPVANTPEEAREMHELAEERGLVLLEGMHIRFHPALNRVKDIIESGELGALKDISTTMFVPKGFVQAYNTSDFGMGRGAVMDTGCYNMEITRFLSSSYTASLPNITSATYTSCSPSLSNLDRATSGKLVIPNNADDADSGITASFACDLSTPLTYGFIPRFEFSVTAECERGNVHLSEFMMPQVHHSITVLSNGARARVEKAYVFPAASSSEEGGDSHTRGEDWWGTFQHQLEAFVLKTQGKTPRTWYGKEDSIAEMEILQRIYQKMGIEVRPFSEYYLQTRDN